jgi:hypothetical protein
MLPRSLPSGWGDSVGNVKIRHYVRKKSGFCYWQPTRRMRDLGFRLVPLGKHGHSAWALAEEWNKKWDAVRRGEAPPLLDLSKLSRDQAEAARRYPSGSVGAAFQSSSERQNGSPTPCPHGIRFGGRRGSEFVTCGVMSRPTLSPST